MDHGYLYAICLPQTSALFLETGRNSVPLGAVCRVWPVAHAIDECIWGSEGSERASLPLALRQVAPVCHSEECFSTALGEVVPDMSHMLAQVTNCKEPIAP